MTSSTSLPNTPTKKFSVMKSQGFFTNSASSSSSGTFSSPPGTNSISAPATQNLLVSADNWDSLVLRTQPRKSKEQVGQIAQFPRGSRRSLSAKEHDRLVESMTTALSQTKFSAVDLNRMNSDDSVQLEHTATLSQMINEVKHHFRRYDLLHIFQKFPVLDFSATSEPDYWASPRKTIDLLESFDTIAIDEVVKTVIWCRKYFDDEYLKELNWSSTFLHKCCEGTDGEGKNLYSIVGSDLDRRSSVNESSVGGPVTFDLAAIPIGAYEPRSFMKSMHIDPYDAVKMMDAVKAKVAFPIHWGAFALTCEPMLEPRELLAEAMDEAGKDALTFQPSLIGETRIV